MSQTALRMTPSAKGHLVSWHARRLLALVLLIAANSTAQSRAMSYEVTPCTILQTSVVQHDNALSFKCCIPKSDHSGVILIVRWSSSTNHCSRFCTLFLGKVTRYAILTQGMPSSPHGNAIWQSSMAKRLAMQDRAVNAPVAFGQQIKVATNAQV